MKRKVWLHQRHVKKNDEQHPGQASQQVMRHHLLVECQTLLQHSHLHIACKQSKKEQFLR